MELKYVLSMNVGYLAGRTKCLVGCSLSNPDLDNYPEIFTNL